MINSHQQVCRRVSNEGRQYKRNCFDNGLFWSLGSRYEKKTTAKKRRRRRRKKSRCAVSNEFSKQHKGGPGPVPIAEPIGQQCNSPWNKNRRWGGGRARHAVAAGAAGARLIICTPPLLPSLPPALSLYLIIDFFHHQRSSNLVDRTLEWTHTHDSLCWPPCASEQARARHTSPILFKFTCNFFPFSLNKSKKLQNHLLV